MFDPDMPVQATGGSDAAVAFALFQHIAATDPPAVGSKDAAIAVFRECIDTVRHRPDHGSIEPRPIRMPME